MICKGRIYLLRLTRLRLTPLRLTPLTRLIKLHLITSTLMLLSAHVFAANIFIPLESVAELGEGRGGGAAIAEDATTNYYNPAGLTRIDHQQIVGLVMAPYTHQQYTGTMTNPGITVPLGFGLSINANTFESGSASTTASALLPYFHYVAPLNERWRFGLSLLSLYGLGINYPLNSILRYEVNKAFDRSYDFSPSLAYRINSKLSVGVGLDVVYLWVMQKSAVRTQPLTVRDAVLLNHASAVRPGWHAGILMEFTPTTRLGLSYRSSIITHLTGTSKFYPGRNAFPFPPLPPARTSDFNVTIPLASQTTLSLYHDVTPCWAVMGSVEYQRWSVYGADHINHIASPMGPVDEVILRNFRNTWFLGLGSRYQFQEQWLIRGGLTYAQGSTTTGFRDVLIVDPNQYGVDIGLRYIQNCHLTWDIGFGYTFSAHVPIHYKNPITQNHLNGTVNDDAMVAGLQATWNMI